LALGKLSTKSNFLDAAGRLATYQVRRKKVYAIPGETIDVEEEEGAKDNGGEEDLNKGVHAACLSMRGTENKLKSKLRWPEGKTFGGHTFARDDSVSSPWPLPGPCYVCTSPSHFACDCPQYGKWETLHRALLIQVDADQSVMDLHDQQYLAMLIESKAETSAYALERERKEIEQTKKQTMVVGAEVTEALVLHAKSHYWYNHNLCRSMAFLDKGKTKAFLPLDSELASGTSNNPKLKLAEPRIVAAPKGRTLLDRLATSSS
jgi:hypothetical protein